MIAHVLLYCLVIPVVVVIVIWRVINHFLPGSSGAAAGMNSESLPARIWQAVTGWFRFAPPELVPAPPAPAPAASSGAPRRQPPPLAAVPDDVARPAEVAAIRSAGVPPAWSPLISSVADFEPEDAGDYMAFMRGNGAGFLALAEAFRDCAETMLNQIGLSPAAVHSMIDMADLVADGAQGANLVIRKFLIVYGHILESDVQLPHNAREWLTGGDA